MAIFFVLLMLWIINQNLIALHRQNNANRKPANKEVTVWRSKKY